MANIIGQLRLDGSAIPEQRFDIPGYGEIELDLPEGTPPLWSGDWLDVTVRLCIVDPHFPTKHNSEGIGTAAQKLVLKCAAVQPDTVVVEQVITKKARDEQWNKEVAG